MTKIRLWKLGNIEHRIAPTSGGVQKLADALKVLNEEGGDLIWGPDLEVVTVEGEADIIVSHLEDGTQKITKVERACADKEATPKEEIESE